MSKKPSPPDSKILPTSVASQIQVADSLLFKPSYEQVQIKSAFWAKFSANPLVDVNQISLPTVQRFVPEPKLARWWQMFGFQEWFLNESEFTERVTSLAYLALSALEDILTNPDANANARISAARLVFEASNKMPKQKNEKIIYLDDQIQKMDQGQLEAFLRQKALVPASSEPSS